MPNYLSSTAQAVVPEQFGIVECSMPTAYWDAYLSFLLSRIAAEYPGLTQSQLLNLALGDLQLVANGDAALRSLAVFRRGLEKRERYEGRGKRLWAVVRREMAWRKVFNF